MNSRYFFHIIFVFFPKILNVNNLNLNTIKISLKYILYLLIPHFLIILLLVFMNSVAEVGNYEYMLEQFLENKVSNPSDIAQIQQWIEHKNKIMGLIIVDKFFMTSYFAVCELYSLWIVYSILAIIFSISFHLYINNKIKNSSINYLYLASTAIILCFSILLSKYYLLFYTIFIQLYYRYILSNKEYFIVKLSENVKFIRK